MSVSEQASAILDELTQRPIAYHRAFARIGGGACAGLMLSQAWYWTPRGRRGGGWFYKSAKEWEAETGLTRREQETARRKLRERGLIEEELKGIPATMNYRVNQRRLIELLTEVKAETSLAESDELEMRSVFSSMAEPAELDEREASNKQEQTRRTITENTSETTTKSTDNKKYGSGSHQGERVTTVVTMDEEA